MAQPQAPRARPAGFPERRTRRKAQSFVPSLYFKAAHFRQGLYRFTQNDALAQPERQRLHDGPLDKRALALHLREAQGLVERERGRVAAQYLERDEGHA